MFITSHHLHLPLPRPRPPAQSLHPPGHTRHPRPMLHRNPTHHPEHMMHQEVTMPHQGATALHLGTTIPLREAMMPLEAMGQREHMIQPELTQQREATPHPHRMSRHPHTGKPCPSAMITLSTRQSPLIDSRTPNSPSTQQMYVCVCLCVCVY